MRMRWLGQVQYAKHGGELKPFEAQSVSWLGEVEEYEHWPIRSVPFVNLGMFEHGHRPKMWDRDVPNCYPF